MARESDKTIECPVCGSSETVEIVYGMPGLDLQDAYHRGEVALGGCVVSVGQPSHKCTQCEETFLLPE